MLKQRRYAYKPRLECLEDRCTPSAGMLDPTFGSGGIVNTSLASGTHDYVQSLVVQPDGKILATGEVLTWPTTGKFRIPSSQYGLARYNPDGSLDSSFGNGGIVVLGKQYEYHMASRVALQPDGKIDVLDGWSGGNGVLQFKANGNLDGSFGKGGQATIPFGTGQLTDLIVQPPAPGQTEGKIIVSGSDANGVCGLARLNPGGSLDSTFGSGGYETTTIAGRLALQSTGKIIVSGGAVARFNPNGSLDTTFGSGGYAANGGAANGGVVAVQGNDQIVTVGGPQESQVTRYNSDGTLDTSFGNGGITASPWGNSGYNVITTSREAVTIGRDGNIIVAGIVTGGIMVGRYLGSPTTIHGTTYAAGSLDPTFGTSGVVTTAVNDRGLITMGYKGMSVVIQADGKIVVGGAAAVGSYYDFALFRYLPSAPQIGSFTAIPNPVTAGGSVTLTASNITDGNPGSTVTQVAFYLDSNGDGILEPGSDTLLGYGTLGGGTWTLTFSTAGWASAIDTLFAQAEDSYGVFGDPFALSLSVQ
jgi:uncharacterized delta-60 repeat protein